MVKNDNGNVDGLSPAAPRVDDDAVFVASGWR